MKKLLFLGACLVALASQPVMAQTGGADVVTVKVKEGYYSLEIIVSRTNAKVEVLKFSARELKEDGAIETATQRVLAKLYQEGYTLKGTFGEARQSDQFYSTLIFTKGQ